jgi:hypothetical protein
VARNSEVETAVQDAGGAFINKSVNELQKRLSRLGIKLSRSELRSALARAFASASAASGIPSSKRIAAMLTRQYEAQRLLAAGQTAVLASIVRGRSKGGVKGSEAHRKNRKRRAASWWQLASRMDGSLSERALRIANRERRLGIDAPTHRQVYDALRRYRPKMRT